MPKIEYKSIKFQQKSLELINLVNQVVEEYQAQGYELTLRQAYYQLVARGYIPNNERSYKNIGNLINDGRLAGLIDWYSITDRTRNLRKNGHWDNPADVIASARYSYLLNKWDGQPNYVEVWVEKDALVDIVGQACTPLDTPYFSCRGYTSQSEMWSAAQRLRDLVESTEDRLIIFYNFTAELEAMQKKLADLNRPYSVVNGSKKDLTAYDQADDSITFIQYQAGAMGGNYQKANKIIYFTLPLGKGSCDMWEQSKKRIHRIGQAKPCFYYYLLVKGTVEERNLAALKEGKELTDELFKNT